MLHEDELHSFYNTLASHTETDTGKSLLGARMSYYEQAPHKAFLPQAVAFVASCMEGTSSGLARNKARAGDGKWAGRVRRESSAKPME